MWDLIVQISDHCLSFYFIRTRWIFACIKHLYVFRTILYLDPKGLSGRSYLCTIPQTFLSYKKKHRAYARCSLTGNKNLSAIIKLTNILRIFDSQPGYAGGACRYLKVVTANRLADPFWLGI